MNGTSPAPLPLPKAEIRSVERLSAFLGDADGEDEGVDGRECAYRNYD